MKEKTTKERAQGVVYNIICLFCHVLIWFCVFFLEQSFVFWVFFSFSSVFWLL